MSLRPRLRTPIVSRAAQGTVSRVSWGLADQTVSSLTNFAVGIVVARELGASAFGVFTLAWVTYGVALNLSRGLATDPLAVRFSGVARSDWRAATIRATGTASVLGLAAGVLCVLVGLAAGGPIGGPFIALGLVLPGLLLQDSWRFAFFADGRGSSAFLNDIVWGLLLVPAMLVAAWHGSVSAFVLAWGASACVAACVGLVQARLVPDLTGTRSWTSDHGDLGTRYMVENVSNSGAAQLRMYGLGAIAGFSDVGVVRGAELLMGPFLALLMGLSLVAVPEAARVLRHSPTALRRFCLLLGGGQALAALGWGLALLIFLPDRIGVRVLGEVWESSSDLIAAATISVAFAGLCTGAAAGLRALGAARRSLRAQLVVSTGYLTGGLVGASIAGASGSAWGVATAMAVGAVVWWMQLQVGIREHRSDLPSGVPPIVQTATTR